MQKIISWNVASVRARMPALIALLKQEQPDVVLLQEIKATEDTFPFFDLRMAGYSAVIAGQKSLNGVAILSKEPIASAQSAFPDDPDAAQARFIQARIGNITYACAYVPNGNPPMNDPTDTTRLAYKIKWIHAFTRHIETLIHAGQHVVLGGDFNVIEHDTDVYNAQAFAGNALTVPEIRAEFAKLTALPLANAIRQFNPEPHTYSFWDFQMGAWQRNWGILLDFLFTSPSLAVQNAGILKDVRGWDKTSDHAPVWCAITAP